MNYAVIVNMEKEFFRFEYPTAEKALEVIDMLEDAMHGEGKACVRINHTIVRAQAIQSVQLLGDKDPTP